MTAIRPTLPKLAAPLAAFACVLALLTAFDGSPESEAPGIGGPPARAPGYASLGDAHLQKARETGDPTYYSRADRSFAAALRRDPRSIDAVVGAGTLAGLRHDFGEQLRRGLEARRLAPALASPYPVIADAQIELGRYRAAERTIQRMLDLKPNLASYARVSYYRELSGDLEGAVQAMRLAVSAGAGARENVAYVQTLLGDLELQRDRLRPASAAYRAALAGSPSYPPAMVGLARIDAAGGRLDRSAARLRRAADRLPLTSTLTLLSEVERAAGRPAAARAEEAAARAQHRLYRASGTAPDAEAVVFEANHGSPAAAVRLGRRVWKAAPSVRSADALGWALTRARRPSEGLARARRALRLGSRDPLFRLHAGLAAREAGRDAEAARHLRIARSGAAALAPSAREELR
jgi:tetratricopeptide (TPR) repeat protein